MKQFTHSPKTNRNGTVDIIDPTGDVVAEAYTRVVAAAMVRLLNLGLAAAHLVEEADVFANGDIELFEKES